MVIVFRFHYPSILKVTRGNAIEVRGQLRLSGSQMHLSVIMVLN